jgi:hypothetical protein
VTEKWSPGRVTWTNKPAVNGGAAVTEVVASALPDGGLVEVDVTTILQSVAAGTEWFGLRIATGSGAAGQAFYSTDSGSPAWELAITLSDVLDQPVDLRPDGGAIPTGEPILAWLFADIGGGSNTQAESQVQVDSPAVSVDPDEVSPDYDSGWVTNVDPQYDLSAVTYTPPASPAQSTFWRVRVRDEDGVISEWSDWADFTVDSLPTLVVDSPTGAFGDPAMTLEAHLTGGTVKSWKAFVTGADRSDVRVETGAQTGDIEWAIPDVNADGRRVLTEDEAGWIYLRVVDTVDRAPAVGRPPYVDVWIPADLTEGGASTPPTGLTVTQIAAGHPQSQWEWSRAAADVPWLIQVDGVTVKRLEPEDVEETGGVYTWTDSGEVSPLRPHTLGVRAIDGVDTTAAATQSRAHKVTGVWLLPAEGDPIQLRGRSVGEFVRTDRVATYAPLKGPEVDVIYDYTGRAGSFSGGIDSRDDVWNVVDRIEALSTSRRRTARMVWGSQSITVRIADLDVTPDDSMESGNLRHKVRFRFVQVGD